MTHILRAVAKKVSDAKHASKQTHILRAETLLNITRSHGAKHLFKINNERHAPTFDKEGLILTYLPSFTGTVLFIEFPIIITKSKVLCL